MTKIIDYKKKPSRFYYWYEEYEIVWDKLTYIDLRADGNILVKLKHPNGKVLSRKEMQDFVKLCISKIVTYAEKVSKREPEVHETIFGKKRYRTDYCFSVSNDRTKSKKLHEIKVMYQYYGDDCLYFYKNYNDIIR